MPRMTLSNLMRMRDESIRLLALCKVNKAGVLMRSLFGKLWTREELFHTSMGLAPQEAREALETYEQQIQVRDGVCVRWRC